MAELYQDEKTYPHLHADCRYCLAYNCEDKRLRGWPVKFKGYIKFPWDIRRAVVDLLDQHGHPIEEYLVTPSIVIPDRR